MNKHILFFMSLESCRKLLKGFSKYYMYIRFYFLWFSEILYNHVSLGKLQFGWVLPWATWLGLSFNPLLLKEVVTWMGFSFWRLGWDYHLSFFLKEVATFGGNLAWRSCSRVFFVKKNCSVCGGKENFGKTIKPSTFGLKRGF
jgi:hypothetical protein